MDHQEVILRGYKTHGLSASWLTIAARDPRLQTSFLFALAVRDHSLLEPEVGTKALLVLQQRCDIDTATFLIAALRSKIPVERTIAASAMKEFPRLDSAPTPHSREFLHAISAAALEEQDTEALAEFLRAAAWQRLDEAQTLLLRFRADPRMEIRSAVAGSILVARSPDANTLRDEVLDALLVLASDESDWIAGAVLYDVAAHPELFASRAQSFLAIANRAKDSAGEDLRKWATAAAGALASSLTD